MTRKPPAIQRPKSVLASAPYGDEELDAIEAWSTGTASREQQILSHNWVVDIICRTDDIGYEPGETGRRDTDFLQGRRYVGLEIRKMCKGRQIRLLEAEHERMRLAVERLNR